MTIKIVPIVVLKTLIAKSHLACCREHGDQTKTISYTNAFSSSHLSSHLVKWASNQIGMEGKVSRPNGTSPKALISKSLDAYLHC